MFVIISIDSNFEQCSKYLMIIYIRNKRNPKKTGYDFISAEVKSNRLPQIDTNRSLHATLSPNEQAQPFKNRLFSVQS